MPSLSMRTCIINKRASNARPPRNQTGGPGWVAWPSISKRSPFSLSSLSPSTLSLSLSLATNRLIEEGTLFVSVLPLFSLNERETFAKRRPSLPPSQCDDGTYERDRKESTALAEGRNLPKIITGRNRETGVLKSGRRRNSWTPARDVAPVPRPVEPKAAWPVLLYFLLFSSRRTFSTADCPVG